MRSGPEWPGGFYCLWLGNETPHKLEMKLGSAQTRAGWGVAWEKELALPAKSQPLPLCGPRPVHKLSEDHSLPPVTACALGLRAHTPEPCPRLRPDLQGVML